MAKHDLQGDPSRELSEVHGDQFNIGDISNVQSLNVGSGKQVIVTKYGSDATELAAKFLEIYNQIDRRPEDPNVDKDIIARTVKDLETEAGKDQPNTSKMSRWITALGRVAPDILRLVVAILPNLQSLNM